MRPAFCICRMNCQGGGVCFGVPPFGFSGVERRFLADDHHAAAAKAVEVCVGSLPFRGIGGGVEFGGD